MAVYEATLTKTLSNGEKAHIYPKTNASIVKYGNTNVSAVLAIIQGNSSTSGSMDYKIAQFNENTIQTNYVAKTDIATTSAVGVVKIGSNISVDAAGTISVANASISAAGVVQLNNSTSSTSTTQAATANAVKNAYDAATTVMGAASASAAGTAGRVPASTAGDQEKFLRADATWAEIPETYTHPTYTATTGIETGNQSVQLGKSVNVSQVATDSTGHVTSQTTRTITFTHPTYTAQTGVATANQTPAFGDTFNIDQFTSDTSGHISGRTTRTVTIPATIASASTLGLVMIGSNITISSGVISVTEMGAATANTAGTAGVVPASSAGDQDKFLRADATWATPYIHPNYTATTGVESTNQSVALGSSINVSQVVTDSTGHVTGQTTRTITFTHPTYTATTGVETANQSVMLGSSVNVSQVATDSTGHVTNQTTRTITFTHPSYTAQTGVATANQTPVFGGTFNIDQFVSDSTGHISSRTTRTVTIPATAATTDALGLVKIGTNITVSSGIISVANASTSAKGVVQLSDSVSSTSTTLAATANAVKTAYDKATTVYVGATSSAAGTAGIVPAATSAQKDYFLRGDGTWAGAGSSSYVFTSSDEAYKDYLGVFLDQSNNVLAYFDEYGNFHVTGNVYSANL